MGFFDRFFKHVPTVAARPDHFADAAPRSFDEAVRIVRAGYSSSKDYKERDRVWDGMKRAAAYIGGSGDPRSESVLVSLFDDSGLVNEAAKALVKAVPGKAYDHLIALFESHPNSDSSDTGSAQRKAAVEGLALLGDKRAALVLTKALEVEKWRKSEIQKALDSLGGPVVVQRIKLASESELEAELDRLTSVLKNKSDPKTRVLSLKLNRELVSAKIEWSYAFSQDVFQIQDALDRSPGIGTKDELLNRLAEAGGLFDIDVAEEFLAARLGPLGVTLERAGTKGGVTRCYLWSFTLVPQ